MDSKKREKKKKGGWAGSPHTAGGTRSAPFWGGGFGGGRKLSKVTGGEGRRVGRGLLGDWSFGDCRRRCRRRRRVRVVRRIGASRSPLRDGVTGRKQPFWSVSHYIITAQWIGDTKRESCVVSSWIFFCRAQLLSIFFFFFLTLPSLFTFLLSDAEYHRLVGTVLLLFCVGREELSFFCALGAAMGLSCGTTTRKGLTQRL